jgi:hypothetical protein
MAEHAVIHLNTHTTWHGSFVAYGWRIQLPDMEGGYEYIK